MDLVKLALTLGLSASFVVMALISMRSLCKEEQSEVKRMTVEFDGEYRNNVRV